MTPISSGWRARNSVDQGVATSANAIPIGPRKSLSGEPMDVSREIEDPEPPKKKKAGWNSPPVPPFQGGFSAPDLSLQESAAQMNLSAALLNAAPLDQGSKHARKIYIGNLPPSITQETVIAQFFNQTLAALLPNKPPGDSIVGTYLNMSKRFAFVENRSIEETTFTLGLDGIQMDGYALKLRRPQDYNPKLAQQQLAIEMQLKGGISSLRGAVNLMAAQQAGESGTTSAPGIVSTSVEDGPNKVFIGGLPHHMMETDVKELLSSFGSLKAFHLVKDRDSDRSKGFAFCEWRDPTVTDLACAQLNGLKLGDRFLNVRRAIGHQQHRMAVGLGAAGLAAIQNVTQSQEALANFAAAGPDALLALTNGTNEMVGPDSPLATILAPPIPELNIPPLSTYFGGNPESHLKCVGIRSLRKEESSSVQSAVSLKSEVEAASKPTSDSAGRNDETMVDAPMKEEETKDAPMSETAENESKAKESESEVKSKVATAEEWADVLSALRRKVSEFGRLRNSMFHPSEGGQILLEFASAEEATAVSLILTNEKINGFAYEVALTDLLPHLRTACLKRLVEETDRLSRMEQDARQLYIHTQNKRIEYLRAKRGKILAERRGERVEDDGIDAQDQQEAEAASIQLKMEDNVRTEEVNA